MSEQFQQSPDMFSPLTSKMLSAIHEKHGNIRKRIGQE